MQTLGNIRRAIRDTAAFDTYKRIAAYGDYVMWKLKGSPEHRMTHLVKQRAIAKYARDFNLRVFVETGTNLGQMIMANRHLFDEIHSVEMDDWRHQRAVRKFANDPAVHIHFGDSAVVFPKLIPALSRPALIWLDAHDFEFAAPIRAELSAVFAQPQLDHVILIDDAKWFDGSNPDYPTLDQVREQVKREYPGRVMEVADCIIRIHKPRSG